MKLSSVGLASLSFSMTTGALSTSQISRAWSAFAPEKRAMAASTASCCSRKSRMLP